MAKPNSLTVRYTIEDNFLRFWFKYIDKNRSIIELKNYVGLREIIKEDYATYSGLILEKYFIQKLAAPISTEKLVLGGPQNQNKMK